MSARRFGSNGRLALALATGLLMVAPLRLAAARAQGTLSALETEEDQIARRGRASVLTVLAQSAVTGVRGPGRVQTRVGTGVAIEDDGILTTASVVLGSERIAVRTANGIDATAQVVGIDPIYNVALLRAPDIRVPALPFASDHPAKVLDWVMALGTSFHAQPTQSVGNIAYVYRDPRIPLLELTNTVYPGNSGGAALNSRGELIGIIQGELGTPGLAGGGDSERRPSGASFVLPADIVKPVCEALRRDGRVHHGYLGVTTRAASVESETEPGAQVPLGATVEGAVVNGPAYRAGIQRGDLIVAFDRERVEYPEQLARWVATTPPGRVVEVVWVRNEHPHTSRVTLGESSALVPEWIARGPAPSAPDPSRARISQLEKQVRELKGRLEHLKTP